jgi:penicillin amidase
VKRLRIFLAIFSLTLIIILSSVILLLRRVGMSSLPQQDGAVAVRYIGGSVEVLRDTLGVPYIVAKSDSDAYFALGFVHAQDRLFQMEMYRRLGEGRLSEVLGRKTVEMDELFRTLRFSEMADSIYALCSPISKDILRWYSNGINEYLAVAKAPPVEFSMLQFEPAPWRPGDCVIVARLMAWELNISWWTKPVFGEIFNRLGQDTASLLIPQFDLAAKPNRPPGKISLKALNRFIDLNSAAMMFVDAVPSPDGAGSNNWTISPGKTSTGSAILCNDPHLALTEPAKWYFVSISSPESNVMGTTLPGAPGIVSGRNEDISWGMTNVMADDADFYIIQMDSSDPHYYWYDGKLVAFQATTDTIRVKDESPLVFTKRMTLQGPVVTDVISGSYGVTSLKSEVTTSSSGGESSTATIALRWNAFWPSDEIKAIHMLSKAGNFQDFLNALKHFGVPTQNFVYADTKGNIGYKAAGNIPLRKYPLPFLPQPGVSSKFVWQDFVPFESLPESYNPSSGFIATANNETTPDNYPYYLTNLYEPSARINRINSFISEHDPMSIELCRQLQLDYQSELMSLLNDKVLAACDSEKYSPKELIYLRNFYGNIGSKSTAAAILNETYVEIMKELFEPILGDSLYREYALISNVPTRTFETMLNNTSRIARLYGVTNGDSLLNFKLAESLENALGTLRAKYGQQPINWVWGTIHTLELKHPLSSNSLIKNLYDLGPYPRGGNNTTVNNGEYSIDDPFAMMVGPSMRMIVDMRQNGMYFSLPGGECGQLLSTHYSDFLNGYLAGEMRFFPMHLSPKQIVYRLELLAAGRAGEP